MSTSYKRQDSFYSLAKNEGFRSRSAYKLLELQKKYSIIKKGNRVLDLGAWPGGWMQVSHSLVENHGKSVGKVLGVDINKIEPFYEENISFLTGDFTQPETIDLIKEFAESKFNVILCDASPKLTGIRERDEAACEECWRGALYAANHVLKIGGNLVVKIFRYQEANNFVKDTKKCFKKVITTSLKSTRNSSGELYMVATNFIPNS